MKILKDTFQSIGLILLGAFSIVVVLGILLWEGLKLIGRLVAWILNAKLQEKYHQGE